MKNMSVALFTCCALFSTASIYTIDDVREPLTPVEVSKIEEERINHYPEELMQNAGLFSTTENFNDDQYLYLVHPNAFTGLLNCSAKGDKIQLNDDSWWSIALFDRRTVLDWRSDDILVIKPRNSWFSYYEYLIQNRTTGQSIDANFLSASPLNVPRTYRIVAIDPIKRIVELNDATFWQISETDFAFRKWQVGDKLIVGVNNYWRMGSFVHVLINTTYYNSTYCEANYVGS